MAASSGLPFRAFSQQPRSSRDELMLTIRGSVPEGQHIGWVHVDSFSLGTGRSINTPVGSTSKREVASPNLSEIQIIKKMDVSPYCCLFFFNDGPPPEISTLPLHRPLPI